MSSDPRVYRSENTDKRLSSFDKRNELFAEQFFGKAMFLDNGDVLAFCVACFKHMTHSGSTMEHLVTPTQMKADLRWSQETIDAKYNHDSNLVVTCSGCNTARGTTDLFEWWASEESKSYLHPDSREKALSLIQQVMDKKAKYKITHIAFGEWRSFVLAVASKVVAG